MNRSVLKQMKEASMGGCDDTDERRRRAGGHSSVWRTLNMKMRRGAGKVQAKSETEEEFWVGTDTD